MEQRSQWDAEQQLEVDGPLDEAVERPLFDVLTQLGVHERPARVLAFLAVEGNGRSAEIEEACALRQPEVSQATIELRDKGWVVAEREKRPGKGRPVNNYRLAVPLEDIVAELEAKKREEINEELARLERLKSLIHESRE